MPGTKGACVGLALAHAICHLTFTITLVKVIVRPIVQKRKLRLQRKSHVTRYRTSLPPPTPHARDEAEHKPRAANSKPKFLALAFLQQPHCQKHLFYLIDDLF